MRSIKKVFKGVILPLLVIVFVAVSCKKDNENNSSISNERIIERITYGNEDPFRKVVYAYEGDKISMMESYLYFTDPGWVLAAKTEFDYPQTGMTIITGFMPNEENEWVPIFKYEMLHVEDLLVENVFYSYSEDFHEWLPQSKSTWAYTSGLLENYEMLFYDNGWTEHSRVEFENNGEEITGIKKYSKLDNNWYQHANAEISYKDGLMDEVMNYDWTGDDWQFASKYDYAYSGKLVKEHICYHRDELTDSLVQFYYHEFDYTSSRNISHHAYLFDEDLNEDYFTYEKGEGNYDQVLGALSFLSYYPTFEPIAVIGGDEFLMFSFPVKFFPESP